MKTETCNDRLVISGFDRLSATNAAYFKELACAMLTDAHRVLDVDLAGAKFIDSDGLGALIALNKRLGDRQGHVRLLQPQPLVGEMLRLLLMDRVFEIVSQ